jgi:hypothetical protein
MSNHFAALSFQSNQINCTLDPVIMATKNAYKKQVSYIPEIIMLLFLLTFLVLVYSLFSRPGLLVFPFVIVPIFFYHLLIKKQIFSIRFDEETITIEYQRAVMLTRRMVMETERLTEIRVMDEHSFPFYHARLYFRYKGVWRNYYVKDKILVNFIQKKLEG